MPKLSHCPECHSTDIKFFDSRNRYSCNNCGFSFTDQPEETKKLRIFLSYGHDANEELVRMIKTDLEIRGHDVWFDKNEIKFGDEWRRSITDGIISSNRVLSFLSKYSIRDPGVCRDEIAIAIGVKGGNIQTILVESEQDVQPPVNIGHIQWLDMHEWHEKRTIGETAWEPWYQTKLSEIISVVESDESRRFAGEIDKLNDYLKPIRSDARIYSLLKKGFYGRQWLFDAVENWRQDTTLDSRLFWIMGDPGVGKSAFAAQLTHKHSDSVIAAQFCDWNQPDHRDARRVLCSIAFQLATRLPDYRKLLLTLPEIAKLDQKGASELFDYLLANPLHSVIDGGRERHLIVIDALDEAGENGRNPLVEMLAQNANHLPSWLGIVVTSRPEFDVKTPFQALNPFPINTKSESNRTDIRDYVLNKLALQLKSRPDAEKIVGQILEKSEGVFLYVERFCEDVLQNHLSLDHPDQFPQGLGGIFAQYFQRQFPDPEKFRKEIRPALRVILAAREPLPSEILQKLFNWADEELRDFIHMLGSLFPVTKTTDNETIKPYHKSLADWLGDEGKAGPFFVSATEGHRVLAGSGWQQFEQGPKTMNDFVLKWLPSHLQILGENEKLFRLGRSEAFLSTQANMATNDPYLPLRTLQIALNAACFTEASAAMVEFTLAQAYWSEHQRVENPLDAILSPSLAADVALHRAWGLADTLEPEARAYALLFIAWQLKTLNRISEADSTLQKIDEHPLPNAGAYSPLIVLLLAWLEPEFNTQRWSCLLDDFGKEDLVSELTRRHYIESAMRIASSIQTDPHHKDALSVIASWQANQGQQARPPVTQPLSSDKPFESIQHRHDTLERPDNVRVIFESLRELASSPSSCSNWSAFHSLRNIATKLAQAGDDAGWAFAKAQGRALSFDNIMERNEALADLAHAQLNIGLFDIACSAAVAIENPGGRCRLLQKIVIKQVQKGQNVSGTLAKALSVPHRSKVEWERCGAFRQIAQTQARLVRDDSRPTFTEALCVTVNISDVIKRSEAMIEIAASQAKVGFFDEAISTATEVSSTSCRAMAFLAIAIAQTKAGQNAVTTFAAALKHAIADWTIEESIYALHALRNPNAISNVEQACIYFILEVAKEQVRMGYDTDETFSEAVREAKKLHKLWCVRALCLIAISQARLGKDYGPTLSDAYEEANYILDDNPAYEAIHNAEAQIEKMSSDMPGADTEFETKVVDEYNRELNEIKSAIAKLAGQNNGGVVLETYLSQASRSLETAWRSCGVVTNLYPNKSTEIANFLITFSRKLVT